MTARCRSDNGLSLIMGVRRWLKIFRNGADSEDEAQVSARRRHPPPCLAIGGRLVEWTWVGRKWKWVPFERVYIVGTFWRGGQEYEVVTVRRSVVVTCYGSGKGRAVWRVVFVRRWTTADSWMEAQRMASKWIAAAIGKRAKRTKVIDALDPVISEGRPALTEFMTELEGVKGTQREPSILMISASMDGLKVGLKDDEAGGWVWRVGDNLHEALDAIEKALQSGGEVFRSGQGAAKKKK